MADEPIHPQAVIVANAPPPPPPELYAIVMAGIHDPRQHNPIWYQLIGSLSEKESQGALASTMVTPDLSMFDAGVFSVVCGRNHWQITTRKEDNWTRIVDVAKHVFDVKLYEVSITAIGGNCILHPETKHKRTGPLIARGIMGTNMVPDFGDVSNATATLVSESGRRKTTIEIGESVLGTNRLAVTHSVHRTLPQRPGYYTIGGELQHCDGDWRHGKKFASELVEKFNSLAEADDAT